MTNRFKFRAWNKLRDEMIHPCVGFWGEFIMFNLEDNQSNCLLDEDQLVLMQCTGLKDNNDALIYEGDIVLVLDWTSAEKNTIKTKVIFEKGCFWLEDRYDSKITFQQIYTSCMMRDIKVIGNIYENPELIK